MESYLQRQSRSTRELTILIQKSEKGWKKAGGSTVKSILKVRIKRVKGLHNHYLSRARN